MYCQLEVVKRDGTAAVDSTVHIVGEVDVGSSVFSSKAYIMPATRLAEGVSESKIVRQMYQFDVLMYVAAQLFPNKNVGYRKVIRPPGCLVKSQEDLVGGHADFMMLSQASQIV
jgi:hypothetical protein